MSDYLIPGGALAVAIDTLIENGFGISWYDRLAEMLANPELGPTDAAPVTTTTVPPRSGRRVKYSCSGCRLNAWAKPAAPLMCGKCRLAMRPTEVRWPAAQGAAVTTPHRAVDPQRV